MNKKKKPIKNPERKEKYTWKPEDVVVISRNKSKKVNNA